MSDPQVRDASEAAFTVLTEKELAERRRKEGARIICHGGHYWEQIGAPGFFQPVHLLARLRPAEATRPTPLSWGYRAALRPEDSEAANGTVPVVRLPNLESYGMDGLSANRRNKLRKCQRLVRIVQLTGPELLVEQGYDTVVDALSRTRHKKLPSRESYLQEVKRYFQSDHWCVLAGLVDGKLGGYIDGYVVDGIAYGFNAFYATWALPTNLSTGLIFEFAQICRRMKNVHTFVGGLDAREVPQLGQFKDDMGFVVDRVPIKWDMNVLAQTFIRLSRPHTYYRLTGEA
ncbi:MAG: hypothetical protein ACJ8AT_01735 [Hyalangium sp.]|uniref:hypothetical protein n=1 Tax=Hyalangium sp. TaxID=2028555 RepID=UPI00389AF7DA